MKHYLVEWENWRASHRSLIVYAKDKEQAANLIRAAYPSARHPVARELKVL